MAVVMAHLDPRIVLLCEIMWSCMPEFLLRLHPDDSHGLLANPVEELMRDAIYEVFNIASAAIFTEGRAVFTKMVSDPTCIDGIAGKVLKKPDHRHYFNVLVDGYQGGRFTILSQFVPIKVVNP